MKVSLCKGRFRGIFNPAQLDLDETLEYWSDGYPGLQYSITPIETCSLLCRRRRLLADGCQQLAVGNDSAMQR